MILLILSNHFIVNIYSQENEILGHQRIQLFY